LRQFQAQGGKLLLWAGLSDWMITAENATDYYRAVVQKAGGQAAADDFIGYYTSPSVGHCSGGAGADKFDLLEPMFAWLEKGVKPLSRTIIASKIDAASKAVTLTRPLCRFPRYARYDGGDASKAASFTCVMPDERPAGRRQ
jgi:feruloyl esterase